MIGISETVASTDEKVPLIHWCMMSQQFSFCLTMYSSWVLKMEDWIPNFILNMTLKQYSRKTNMSPENEWLLQMYFLLKGCPKFRGHSFVFGGVVLGHLIYPPRGSWVLRLLWMLLAWLLGHMKETLKLARCFCCDMKTRFRVKICQSKYWVINCHSF